MIQCWARGSTMSSHLRNVRPTRARPAESFTLGFGLPGRKISTRLWQMWRELEAPSFLVANSVLVCRTPSFVTRTAMKLRYGLSESQRMPNNRLVR